MGKHFSHVASIYFEVYFMDFCFYIFVNDACRSVKLILICILCIYCLITLFVLIISFNCLKLTHKAVSNEKVYEPQIDHSGFEYRSKFIISIF